MLDRLQVYGIPGLSVDCFRSYFTNIWQKGEVNSPNTALIFFSDCGKLKHGVPQGLILGSLLFIIHVNDLPLRINSVSEPILFADDTSVCLKQKLLRFLFSVKFSSLSYH